MSEQQGTATGAATPPWPEELVKMGKLAPDHIIRIVDPAWRGEEDEPPDWAVGGAWRTDSEGNIVAGEINEEYRPTPRALGWPEPLDALDAAVQLSATGHGDEDVVARELAAAHLLVFVDENGAPAVVTAPDGTDVVSVSTAGVDVDGTTHPHTRMDLPELLDRTAERYDVYFLSPTAPVSVIVEVETLLDALAGMRVRGEEGAGAQSDEVEAAPVRPTESAAPAWDTAATPRGAGTARPAMEDVVLPDDLDLPSSLTDG
ncbi:type VII secretion system-associated protein [Streptomyces sp. NPDC050848]|uniref:type VII secretion system-associated protein n=1 Tax=Streptomyces sp. NPDC050848 TaxID=3155791 RepID=UPI0033F572AE